MTMKSIKGVIMKQHIRHPQHTKSTHAHLLGALLLGLCLCMPTHANNDNTYNIDNILNELQQQHSNASSLIKATRTPASLVMNSPLMSQSITDSNKDNDMIRQLTAVASNTISKFKQTGLASWYGRQFHGNQTANGERFDMNAMTAAHNTLPLNCYVKVTNKDNGKTVVVRINDRRSSSGRVLDLSYAAAKAIGIAQQSAGNVTIERVDSPQ